jgi:hypothetical protein
MASLPSTPAYELWLTGEGTEPSDRRCPVPPHYVGLRGRRPSFSGVQSPWAGLSALVFTTRSLVDWISYREVPPLPGQTYLVSE